MESRLSTVAAAFTLLLVVACKGRPDAPRDSTTIAVGSASDSAPVRPPARPSLAPDSPSARKVASVADRPAVVFLGTSLTAGLGVDPDQAYPALIQAKIDSAGL